MTAEVNFLMGTQPFELDVKRLHVPFVIKVECSTCKTPLEQDLSCERYLSYPKVGETINHYVYCDKCDETTDVKLKLSIGLEVVP